jgi:hypothetical protein
MPRIRTKPAMIYIGPTPGISGVFKVQVGHTILYRVQCQRGGSKQQPYYGRDFFDACCARKSFDRDHRRPVASLRMQANRGIRTNG